VAEVHRSFDMSENCQRIPIIDSSGTPGVEADGWFLLGPPCAVLREGRGATRWLQVLGFQSPRDSPTTLRISLGIRTRVSALRGPIPTGNLSEGFSVGTPSRPTSVASNLGHQCATGRECDAGSERRSHWVPVWGPESGSPRRDRRIHGIENPAVGSFTSPLSTIFFSGVAAPPLLRRGFGVPWSWTRCARPTVRSTRPRSEHPHRPTRHMPRRSRPAR
jgi:hypothetical protein